MNKVRFSVKEVEPGKFKIWDAKLECFYRSNGTEHEYSALGKANQRAKSCNHKWPRS